MISGLRRAGLEMERRVGVVDLRDGVVRFGDEEMQWPLAMDTTADGDIVLAGAFLGTIALGDATVSAGGDANQAFVVQLAVPR